MKLAKWVLVSVLIFIAPMIANAASDIAGHPFAEQMLYLQEKDIMRGYPDGTFLPDKEVTRAEFAAFLARALNLPPGTVTFSDTVSHSLRKEVESAATAGIIQGVGENLFLPNNIITRQEMAVMLDRAAQLRGLNPKKAKLSYVDNADIKYVEHVQHVVDLQLMVEFSDNAFRPQLPVTRAHTANAIYRLLKKIDEAQADKPKEEEKEQEPTPQEVKDPNLVITNKLANIYDESLSRALTYVSSGTDMKYLGETRQAIYVEVSGIKGYVKRSDVTVLNSDKTSYYTVQNGELVHYILRNGNFEKYIYGPAPVFMREGEQAESWDGKTFSAGTAIQYFNYLPLHTATSYSGEELDEYIKSVQPSSPLVGLGPVFKKVEQETGVNALYLLAHAIHESAWGMSQIARDKYNLYGIRAIDANPYEAAMSFASFEDSIRYAANYVKDKYLTPGERTYYHGAFLGNKAAGLNVYYASDPYWGQKIAGHMYRADRALGRKDWNKYRLAITNVSSLNARAEPSLSASIPYQYAKPGMAMVVLEELNGEEGIWYKIKSDHPNYEEAYVYASGGLGQYAQRIDTAEMFANR